MGKRPVCSTLQRRPARETTGETVGLMEYGSGHKVAAAAAIARSKGTCQFCGFRAATDGHHWAGTPYAGPYPDDDTVTADDEIGLCSPCHELATTLRRFFRRGGDVWQFLNALEKAIETCDTESRSRVLDRSSCTTERPDSTREALPISKRRKSQARKAAIARPSTMTDSESLNAKPVFGSTRKTRQQSRRALSGQQSKQVPES